MSWIVSFQGKNFIKSFEKGPAGGAALTPYYDKKPNLDPKTLFKPPLSAKSFNYHPQYGYLTIGWGHKITNHDKYDIFSKISTAEAESLFEQDLNHKSLNIINRYVYVPLTQCQVDALASYVFNTGSLIGTQLLSNLNKKDYNAAMKQMDIITSGGVVMNGLINRRNAEKTIWAGGNYVMHN